MKLKLENCFFDRAFFVYSYVWKCVKYEIYHKCVLWCLVRRYENYLVHKTILMHNSFFVLRMFISLMYMFRATMCPSSGEITASIWHLIFATLCGWLSGMQGGMKIPPCLPVARNMYRIEINIQRRNCAPGWFYLQDYTRMHDQQNTKLWKLCCLFCDGV
jgi:hypothetical protein